MRTFPNLLNSKYPTVTPNELSCPQLTRLPIILLRKRTTSAHSPCWWQLQCLPKRCIITFDKAHPRKLKLHITSLVLLERLYVGRNRQCSTGCLGYHDIYTCSKKSKKEMNTPTVGFWGQQDIICLDNILKGEKGTSSVSGHQIVNQLSCDVCTAMFGDTCFKWSRLLTAKVTSLSLFVSARDAFAHVPSLFCATAHLVCGAACCFSKTYLASLERN
jgi:hypothetical protein